MAKIVFNAETLKIMHLFETVTKSRVRDCIIDSKMIIFVVGPGMISKAVGKKGVNVRTLENKLNRKIKIVEFNSDVKRFVRNFIMPLKVDEVTEEDNVVTLKSSDKTVKSILIGRNAQNLRKIEDYIRRHHPMLKEIKVI